VQRLREWKDLRRAFLYILQASISGVEWFMGFSPLHFRRPCLAPLTLRAIDISLVGQNVSEEDKIQCKQRVGEWNRLKGDQEKPISYLQNKAARVYQDGLSLAILRTSSRSRQTHSTTFSPCKALAFRWFRQVSYQASLMYSKPDGTER
jgi:hypothetical protein